MFGRVTNLDLLNKILELENKMEIISLQISDDNKVTCCDCKVKELIIYKEMKEYFEDKFGDIIKNIKQIEKTDTLNLFLENYKNDIISNFETIITKLESLNNNDHGLQISLPNFDQNIKDIRKLLTNNNNNENFDKITNQLNTITNKIDLLYYENEIIKHQLLLEEEIRKCEQEVDLLSSLLQPFIN